MKPLALFLIRSLRNWLYGIFLLLLWPLLLLAKDKKKWLRLAAAKLSGTTPTDYLVISRSLGGEASPHPLSHYNYGFLSASVGEAKLALEFARALALKTKGPKSFVFWSENFAGLDFYRLKLPEVFSPQAFPEGVDFVALLHPFDFSFSWKKSFRAFPVRHLFLLESAYWPNTLDLATEQGAKVISINSRLQRGTRRLASLLGWVGLTAFGKIEHFYTSSPTTEKNLLRLKVPQAKISIVPSFKTALYPKIPEDILQQEHQKLFARAKKAEDFLAVVGSVHLDEIAPLLNAWLDFVGKSAGEKPEGFKPTHPPFQAKSCVLVLRHPTKADQARQTLRKKLGTALFEQEHYQLFPAGVGLVSSFGTLLGWYSLADCVIVGGSFNARGGQNFCEPIAFGKYTAVGPYTQNFEAEKVLFGRHQALEVLNSPGEAVAFWQRAFLRDERAENYARRARQTLEQHVFDWGQFAEQVLNQLGPQPTSAE